KRSEEANHQTLRYSCVRRAFLGSDRLFPVLFFRARTAGRKAKSSEQSGPGLSRASPQTTNPRNRQGGGCGCAHRKSEVDPGNGRQSFIGKISGRCHTTMEMGTGSAGD